MATSAVSDLSNVISLSAAIPSTNVSNGQVHDDEGIAPLSTEHLLDMYRLAVKHTFALTLYDRFPYYLSVPSRASVTF